MKRYFIVADAELPSAPKWETVPERWAKRDVTEQRAKEGTDELEDVVVGTETYLVAPVERRSFGDWHSIELGSHGAAGDGFHVVVLLTEETEVPDTWEELAHLLDPALVDPDPRLGDIDVAEPLNGYAMAKRLGAIHSKFRP